MLLPIELLNDKVKLSQNSLYLGLIYIDFNVDWITFPYKSILI